jgi:hypothetical protein
MEQMRKMGFLIEIFDDDTSVNGNKTKSRRELISEEDFNQNSQY